MRKITDFIVKFRYFFLVLFIVLAIISLFVSKKVNINDDIMKYLPKTSETKIGKDIMDEEFPESDSSTLNVMFKGLSSSDKKTTLKKLENIKGVESVNYENTAEYNSGKYTLYVLNVDDYAKSDTSEYVYNYVKDNFKTAGMSGTIYDEYKPLLQLWIVVLAIVFAMIILIVLSESYVEPFLYLISIGIAVFINKGTNIMFDSVSSITDSISAILQLALSMDYSIMLSNRFKQEKAKNPNKLEAMKEALYNSFKSISSSSVTTVVGLLALIFMSFTIGRDMGVVLAKGVLLSLVSIFFCLPALLLIFDDLIGKTQKPAPKFNLTKLGAFSYKTRFLQLFLIVFLFIGAYLLKGNVGILYTGSQQDEVGKVFSTTNQIAIVYENKYENLITNYCKELENDKNIDQVLCYSNTINEKLAYNELNDKLLDLGENIDIEDYLIKIIYYNYYMQDKNNSMTLEQFISFIKSDVYSNKKLDESIDESTKENLNKLINFTYKDEINKKRSMNDIASILGIDESTVNSIMIYYNSKNNDDKMTVQEFVNFMLNDVVDNKLYSSQVSSSQKEQLETLKKFTNKSTINKKMSSKELASLFSMDKSVVDKLMLFYRTTLSSNTKLTLNEFANFALTLSSNDDYKDMFDKDTLSSLKMLSALSNNSNINTKLDITSMNKSLSSIGLDISIDNLKLIYILNTGINSNSKLTMNEFATVVLNMYSNDAYKSYFTEDLVNSINTIKTLNVYADVTMPNSNLYSMFGISTEKGQKLNYALTGTFDGVYYKTPKEFVALLLNTSGISSQFSSEELASLTKALYIMNNTKTTYSVAELSTALSTDSTIVAFVYGINEYTNNNLSNMSIKELVNLLYSNQNNNLIANSIEKYKDSISLAYNVVNNTNKKFSYSEISSFTGTSKETVNKIFDVYDYMNEETKLSPLELANLIINNKDNELLSDKIDSESLKQLKLVRTVMNSTLNNIKYDYSEMSELLGIDSSTLKLLYGLHYSINNPNQKVSLYNFVKFIVKDVMNNSDYSSKFDNSIKNKLTSLYQVMTDSLNGVKYSSTDAYKKLSSLSDGLDSKLIDLVYIYYGSVNSYNNKWTMTIEEFINYLNNDILKDDRFTDFIDGEMTTKIEDGKVTIDKSKNLLVSEKYSRVVLNTKYPEESQETFDFVEDIRENVGNREGVYVVGNSSMAVDVSKTFNDELNKITILTMIFIFVVVAITFKDLLIPLILVLIIQCAVFTTMSVISLSGGSVYFISLLIVQAILMGATIDYAIVYTSYYMESRLTMNVKQSIINAYNKSINTILSSSLILIIVTLVVANFASAIAAKICETISQGTFAAVILILFLLPGVLAATDKLICRGKYYKYK